MKTIQEILTDLTFFAEMPADMVSYIAGCGQNMHFAPGQYIGKEGESADYLYVIRKGNVAVQLVHPSQGPLTIKTLTNGEIAGFSWIIPPFRLQFDLKVLDHTSVIALDGTCLRKKCEEDYQLGYCLMKQSAILMTKRLRDTRLQLLDVYCAKV